MRPLVVLCDPSLRGPIGHMLVQAASLSAAFAAAGASVIVGAHQAFDLRDRIPDAELRPHFRMSPYHMPSKDPVAWRVENLKAAAPRLSEDLETFLRHFAEQDAIIVFPTVNLVMAAALDEALTKFDEAVRARWRIHVLLYLECGIVQDGSGELVTDDTLLALSLRDPLRRLAGTPGVDVWGVSEEIAALHAHLVGRPIASLPSYHSLPFVDLDAPRDGVRRILLYGGQAASNKNFERVPKILRRLPPASATEFIVQLNRSDGERYRAADAEIRALAAERGDIRLVEGHVADADLAQLLVGCEAVLIGYSRRIYGGKTSGFLWDAIRCAATPIVPDGTWLEREARFYGASPVVYYGDQPELVADAVTRALAAPDDRPARLAAARRFAQDAGPAALARRLLPEPERPADPAAEEKQRPPERRLSTDLSSVDMTNWLRPA